MSKEYAEALEKHNEAARVFRAAQEAYRSGSFETDTDAYLKARRVYEEATAEFDAAYAAEQAA